MLKNPSTRFDVRRRVAGVWHRFIPRGIFERHLPVQLLAPSCVENIWRKVGQRAILKLTTIRAYLAAHTVSSTCCVKGEMRRKCNLARPDSNAQSFKRGYGKKRLCLSLLRCLEHRRFYPSTRSVSDRSCGNGLCPVVGLHICFSHTAHLDDDPSMLFSCFRPQFTTAIINPLKSA